MYSMKKKIRKIWRILHQKFIHESKKFLQGVILTPGKFSSKKILDS